MSDNDILQEMRGRLVRCIGWMEGDKIETLHILKGQRLILRFEYLGDHGELWIVLEELKNDRWQELDRFNTRTLHRITWAEEAGDE